MYDFKRGTAHKPLLIPSCYFIYSDYFKDLDLNPQAGDSDRHLLCGISLIGNHIQGCVITNPLPHPRKIYLGKTTACWINIYLCKVSH